MKKFAFSMQKILDMREFERKQAEIELGKVATTDFVNTTLLIHWAYIKNTFSQFFNRYIFKL